MVKDVIVKLGIGLALAMGLMNGARAAHDYTLDVGVDSLPNTHYSIVIFTPQGNTPNSRCMETWQVPAQPETITEDPNGKKSFHMTIKDKNSAPCTKKEKYNTWAFEIRNQATSPDTTNPYMVVASGTFQFYHDHKDGWQTKITAANTGSVNNTPANRTFVSSAMCGTSSTATLSNCLGTFVKGDSAADYIRIRIAYPAPAPKTGAAAAAKARK